MKMKSAIILITYFIVVGFVHCTRVDQSQSGDLNVQVDLKDLQIIALLKGGKEEYVDYDYAYDYNEMTIKPQNRTTPRPLNGTTTTEPDTGTSTKKSTTLAFNDQTESSTKAQITELTDLTTDMTVIDSNTTIKNKVPITTEQPISVHKNITGNINTAGNGSKCKKGFVVNNKGDCEIKLQGTGNALLKLVKLSQRLKLRRENKTED